MDGCECMGEKKYSSANGTKTHCERSISRAMLFTLALLAAVAPFGIDLYLSAFPAMTVELGTTATGVQLSLTAFLVGAGVGQIVFGPWSDRAGRMIPLLSGLVLFLIASIVAVFAKNVEVLVGARLLQGLGGASGMVIGRAMILDRQRGREAARVLSMMMVIGGIAPVIAPLTGSLLAGTIGWRGLLGIVAGLGVLALASTLLFVRETLPRSERESAARQSNSRPRASLASRGYVGNVVVFVFGMSIMMAYISASPFVYQKVIGLSTPQYGVAFAINAMGMVLATALSARLVGRISARALVVSGLVTSFLAVLVILSFTLVGVPTTWLVIPMFCAIAPLGLVFGNATALALSAVPREAAGLASAVLGFLQFLMAGVVAALVGIGGEETTLPLALTMLVVAGVALLGAAFGAEESPQKMSVEKIETDESLVAVEVC